jgi:putative ABC transport system permease protein
MAIHEQFEDLVQDVRYAARGLIRRPGFTTIAILTLAVGIGANTAIFSAVNAIMFRPLPFRDPAALMNVSFEAPASSGRPARSDLPWSWMKYLTFRDVQKQFQDHAAWTQGNLSITGDDAERVSGEWISSRYLTTLGIIPAMGRGFDADGDDGYDARKVVMISDEFWKRRFNADPKILSKTVPVEGQPFEIVGVLPRGFAGLSGASELWIPINTRLETDIGARNAWSHEFQLVARLKPGVPATQAVAAIPVWGAAIAAAWPAPQPGILRTLRVAPLDAGRVSPVIRRSLLVLFGAVGLVLLIACVNLANLLLGRAAARRQEISIRLALGAGRARLVRLLLTESLLLSLLGGAASVAVAMLGTAALAAANPAETLRVQNISGLGVTGFSSIHLDFTALLFTLVVSVTVGVVFGLMPALQATRPSVSHDMKTGASHRTGGGRHWFTSRNTLVVTEVALAIVLLAGSGLMLRSLANLLQVNPGFDSEGLLTLRLTMPRGTIARDSLPGFYDRLSADLAALPGVTGVALGDSPPLAGGGAGTIIGFPDRPPVPDNEAPLIGVHWITPAWFSVMRVPLKRGRLLNNDDRVGAAKSIVISESAAAKFWPGEDPIGKTATVGQGGFGDGATVVGVIGDVRYHTIDSLPHPDVYLPYAQSPAARMMIFVRTARDPLSLAAAARRTVGALVPGVPVFDIKTMASRTAVATAQARFSAVLLAMFAVTALLLAVIGIYGVMSFMVTQRTREIGIRMALGAERSQVQRMVIAEGLWLATAGAALGVGAAIGLTRALRSLLYDVRPGDPATYISIVALLGVAAAIASWIPARRASKVEPTEALRAG